MSWKILAALEAAARLLRGASRHESRQKDFFCTLNVLTLENNDGKHVPTWNDVGRILAHACKTWLQAHPEIRALQMQCRPQALFILGSRMLNLYSPNDSDWLSIVVVSSVNQAASNGRDWLRGFSSALEMVRRNIEESGLRSLMDSQWHTIASTQVRRSVDVTIR